MDNSRMKDWKNGQPLPIAKHEPYCKLPHGGSECACPSINTTRPEHNVEVNLHDALKGAVDLGNEVNKLRAALHEIGEEVAFNGCEGSDDCICTESQRAKEDWCGWCRVSQILFDSQTNTSGVTK